MKLVVIDVRTLEEYQTGHLKDSLLIDFRSDDFQTQINALDRHHNYKLYCRSGARSGVATALMIQLGFKSVENLGSVAQASEVLKIEVV